MFLPSPWLIVNYHCFTLGPLDQTSLGKADQFLHLTFDSKQSKLLLNKPLITQTRQFIKWINNILFNNKGQHLVLPLRAFSLHTQWAVKVTISYAVATVEMLFWRPTKRAFVCYGFCLVQQVVVGRWKREIGWSHVRRIRHDWSIRSVC